MPNPEDLAREYGLAETEADLGLRALRAIEGALEPDLLETAPTQVAGFEITPGGPGGASGWSDQAGFGRYLDAVAIARGGMGTILRVQDPRLGRPVAIKVVSAERPSPEALARFVREARVTGQLEHPSIPPVHELSKTADGRLYFSLKLVSGKSLAQALDELRASRDRVDPVSARRPLLAALLKVCDALGFAHSRGVVHRDLKPSNVMLGDFGEVLVMDWGIAAIMGSPEVPASGTTVAPDGLKTLDGAVLGTPSYMAPEQFEGRHDPVDARADVYALGAVLYEVLTLAPPPLDRIRDRRIEPPSRRAPRARIPPELDALVEKAMQYDRERRYPSVEALRADLVAHLEERLVSAARYGPMDRVVKWVRRNPATAAVTAGAALLLLGVSSFFVWRLDLRRREAEVSARRDGDLLVLGSLEEEARDLWPPLPRREADLERWLAGAEELLGRQDEHRARLASLPDRPDPGRGRLAELVAGLERLREETVPDVERRLSLARAVERAQPRYDSDWARARPAIAGRYSGLSIARQEGLVPLGPDPQSGLWEFAHVLSGEPPERDAEGQLVLGEDSAIVLVLVPGGAFTMGAASSQVADPDPYARPDEAPRRSIEVEPFFVSKDELTRAQWSRLGGGDPGPGGSGVDPVARVSWDEARLVLARQGLELPTEARWEYAARARARAPWWFGEQVPLLQGAANVADQSFHRADPGGAAPWEVWLDDGHARAAPVGSYRANPFGLRDVLGNVAEWCFDEYAPYDRPGDGSGVYRVYRGGSYADLADRTRSAARSSAPPAWRDERLGIRPARRLE